MNCAARRTAVAGLENAVGTVNPRLPGWHNDLIQLIKILLRRGLVWYEPASHRFTKTLTIYVPTCSNISWNSRRLQQVIRTSSRAYQGRPFYPSLNSSKKQNFISNAPIWCCGFEDSRSIRRRRFLRSLQSCRWILI